MPNSHELAKQRLQKHAKKGLFQHAVPEQYGGLNTPFSKLVSAHQDLGSCSQDTGLILSINAHLWGSVFPILNYGTEQQKQTWLPGLINGEIIGGHAITEPQAGSDLNALTSSAKQNKSGFVLNGHKRFITNTPIADLLVVYARLDDKLSAFLVQKDDKGAEFSDSPSVTSCASATMGDVILNNCKIPTTRQLGKTGMGSNMIQQALELERAFIFAGISGIMHWQLNEVIRYSRERKVNGVHLGKNQAISHKIAEMKLRLDTISLWVSECARLKDVKQRITLASAQTKLFCSEAFLQSSLDAAHILGASGLMPDSLMPTFVNDAMASCLFSGSSEIQKNIIAALSGTGDGHNGR
jgi:alkylation response protein AidB-like acyl-CoA dehydrogenase